jgi:hypothetical protein
VLAIAGELAFPLDAGVFLQVAVAHLACLQGGKLRFVITAFLLGHQAMAGWRWFCLGGGNAGCQKGKQHQK